MTKQFELHHYTIQNGKLKIKNKKIDFILPKLEKGEYIHHCQIVGSIDEEQDSIITIFYLVKRNVMSNKVWGLDGSF